MKFDPAQRNQRMTLPRPDVSGDKTWQQTKSENTRTAIMDAALECFYELGYGNTTTEKVAKRAGVSRGAMLHHFPSRIELVKAAVGHLNTKRLEMFEEQELKANEGAQHTRVSEGIDAFWEQLKSPLFVIYHELQVASRTDPDLKEVIDIAYADFNHAWAKLSRRIFPDLALSEEFENANMLTTFLLEGMAVHTELPDEASQRMIKLLKRQLAYMFADVSSVERDAARPPSE